MSDEQFQKLLNKLADANAKYHDALVAAEQEYERRYGSNPSDWDDDFWIDTFHMRGGSNITVAQIAENVKEIKDRNYITDAGGRE